MRCGGGSSSSNTALSPSVPMDVPSSVMRPTTPTSPSSTVDVKRVRPNDAGIGGGVRTTTSTIEAKQIDVKVRVNPGNVSMSLPMSTTEKIQSLKANILRELSPPADKGEPRLRILYMGKELGDDQFVGSMVGTDAGRVVQCFVAFRK